MSFCYKKILGVFTHLRVTTPNIIEPQKSKVIFVPCSFFVLLSSWFDRDIGDNTFKLLVNFLTNTCVCLVLGV